MKNGFLHIIKSPSLQLCSIIGAALYVAIIMYMQTKPFKATDVEPKILAPTAAMENLASKITMGLHINSFPQFSFNQNTFLLNGTIWFKFPVGTEGLQTIENFSIYNSINTKFAIKSKPIIKILDDTVLIAFHIEMEFKANLRFELFPITDHQLHIIFHNKTVTPYEILFDCPQENFILSNNLLINQWKPEKVSTKTGYIRIPLSTSPTNTDIIYPCTMFSINFRNIGISDLVSLYFPMFVLFFIILFSLTISILDITRLNLIAASVPILVLFRLVIISGAPLVGYATHVDYVYYLLVFISLFILLFQAYITLATKLIATMPEEQKTLEIERLETINSLVLLISLILLIIPITYSAYLTFVVYAL